MPAAPWLRIVPCVLVGLLACGEPERLEGQQLVELAEAPPPGGAAPSPSGPGADAPEAEAPANPLQHLQPGLRGASLPAKTIVLTFDDGPGPRTLELSRYLATEKISAVFFVNGKSVQRATDLAQLAKDGHVLANHTQTHRSITGRATGEAHLSDAETVAEIEQTDALIAPHVTSNRFFFRPPFGDFDARAGDALAASSMKKYIDPIQWDIGDHMGPAQAADWDCFSPGTDGKVLTPAQCGALYIKEIETVGRGIVLLHDPELIDDDPTKGGTVDMVKAIVPVLKQKGFTFGRLEDVPDIAAKLRR